MNIFIIWSYRDTQVPFETYYHKILGTYASLWELIKADMNSDKPLQELTAISFI